MPRRPRRAELAERGRRPRPPRLSGVSRCSLQPAQRAPARAPEGRYLGAPAPRSLPAAVGASLQLTHPTSASAEGEGRGRGERRNRPFLRRRPPAGIATSGAGARRSAAQRRGWSGRRRSGRGRRRRPLSFPLAFQDSRRGELSKQDPRIWRTMGLWPHLVWGGSGMGGVSLPLFTPWGLSLTPISWGIPRSDLPPRMTPPSSPAGVPRVHSICVTMTWLTGGSYSGAPGFLLCCASCVLLVSTKNFCGFRGRRLHDFSVKKSYRGLYLEIKFGLKGKKAV